MPDRDDALLQRASDKGQDRPEQEAGAKRETQPEKRYADARGSPCARQAQQRHAKGYAAHV